MSKAQLDAAEKLIKPGTFEVDYDVEHELGRGRFAIVKRCVNKKTGKRYAVKIVKKSKNTHGRSGREQLLMEISILNKSTHPKMVRLYDVFETRSEMQLILEYAEGGDLHRHCIETDIARTEKEICYLIRQILEAVRYLHSEKIVHLDLKPDNILLAKKAEVFPEIRLIDFGLSRSLEGPYSQFDIVGTAEYVSPEVLAFDAIDYGSDMWSIGVVTYVLLSGISPFAGDDVMETYANIGLVDYDFDCEEFDEVSDPAIDFIEKLLLRDPKKRMSSREALEHEWIKQLDGGVSTQDVILAQQAKKEVLPDDVEISPLHDEEVVSSSESDASSLEKSGEVIDEEPDSGMEEETIVRSDDIPDIDEVEDKSAGSISTREEIEVASNEESLKTKERESFEEKEVTLIEKEVTLIEKEGDISVDSERMQIGREENNLADVNEKESSKEESSKEESKCTEDILLEKEEHIDQEPPLPNKEAESVIIEGVKNIDHSKRTVEEPPKKYDVTKSSISDKMAKFTTKPNGVGPPRNDKFSRLSSSKSFDTGFLSKDKKPFSITKINKLERSSTIKTDDQEGQSSSDNIKFMKSHDIKHKSMDRDRDEVNLDDVSTESTEKAESITKVAEKPDSVEKPENTDKIVRPQEKTDDVTQPLKKIDDVIPSVEKTDDITQSAEKTDINLQPVEKTDIISRPVEKSDSIKETEKPEKPYKKKTPVPLPGKKHDEFSKPSPPVTKIKPGGIAAKMAKFGKPDEFSGKLSPVSKTSNRFERKVISEKTDVDELSSNDLFRKKYVPNGESLEQKENDESADPSKDPVDESNEQANKVEDKSKSYMKPKSPPPVKSKPKSPIGGKIGESPKDDLKSEPIKQELVTHTHDSPTPKPKSSTGHKSPTFRRESPVPRYASPTHRHNMSPTGRESPRYESTTTRHDYSSTYETMHSNRHGSPTLRNESPSPNNESPLPTHESPTPKHESPTPKHESPTPKQESPSHSPASSPKIERKAKSPPPKPKAKPLKKPPEIALKPTRSRSSDFKSHAKDNAPKATDPDLQSVSAADPEREADSKNETKFAPKSESESNDNAKALAAKVGSGLKFSLNIGGANAAGKKLNIGPLISVGSKGSTKEIKSLHEIPESHKPSDEDENPDNSAKGEQPVEDAEESIENNDRPSLNDTRGKNESFSRRRGNEDGSHRKTYRRLYVTKVRNSKVYEHDFDISTEAAKIVQRVDKDVLQVEVKLKSTDLKLLP